MVKKPYEFNTRHSELEREFEDRKSKIHKYYKICSKCGVFKMLSEFALDKKSTDNRTGTCKTCRAKEALKYYYENREKILIQAREYQDTHKKDRHKYFSDYQRKHKKHLKRVAKSWYKKNKKEIKKRSLKYYEENKEACQATRELWRENHKEEIKKYNREYKRLKSGASQG